MHAKSIARVYQQIVDSLRRTDRILTALLSEGHLSSAEYQLIRAYPCMHEVVQHLLDALLSKPSEAYDCFVKALGETDQEHIRNLLEKKGLPR